MQENNRRRAWVDTLRQELLRQQDPNQLQFKKKLFDEGPEAAESLLDTIDIDYTYQPNGQTLLHEAILNCRAKEVLFLLYNGASLAIQDDNGQTPLDLAIDLSNTKGSLLIPAFIYAICIHADDLDHQDLN